MQDNYEHEFDELFVNRAWAQMAGLLDREMPVQPQRRPLPWLWILGALLLGSLAGGLLIYAWMQPSMPPQQPSVPATAFADTAPAPATETCPDISHAAEALPEASNLLTTPQAQNPDRHDVSRLTPLSAIAAATTPAPANVLKSSALPPSPTMAPKPMGEAAASLAAALPAMDILPTLNLLLPTEPPIPALLTRAQTSSNKRLAFRLALEIGSFSQSGAIDGYFAGLSGELSPRGKRLYLRSGLHYQTDQRQRFNGEKVFTQQLTPSETSNNISGSSLLSSTSHIIASQSLSLPLTAGYRLSPRLAAEAGLQADFLLSAQAQEEWRLLNGANLPLPQPGNNLLYRFEASNARQQLASTSLGLHAGLAYRLSGRIAARLHYRHGLTDLLSAPAYRAYQRGGWLSATYQLGR
jgi:hypothetical protein